MIDAIQVAEGGYMGTEDAAEDTAEKIAAVLRKDGYTVKVWAKGGYVRVYVSRELARRRYQDMGYIAVESSSRCYDALTRQRAGIRDQIEAALAA
jgi:hypothetical protein